MRKNFKNLISPWIQCTSITKSCSQIIWPSHGLFQLGEIKLKKSHNFLSSVQKYHKWFSQLIDRFPVLTTLWGKTSKVSYLRDLSAQVSQFVFWAHLTVLLLIITVRGKFIKISCLREFSGQVSQIVFWAFSTVFWLIITVWGKSSKISYLRELSAQVSQIVFSNHLTVLRLLPTVRDRTSNI